jgi:hypothetical protein
LFSQFAPPSNPAEPNDSRIVVPEKSRANVAGAKMGEVFTEEVISPSLSTTKTSPRPKMNKQNLLLNEN